jgi:CrcB protein
MSPDPDALRPAWRSFLKGEARDLTLIAIGAVPGALLRWQMSSELPANLIGCLLLGLITSGSRPRPRLMLLAGIGFCGSLTTFSSWMLSLSLAAGAGGPAVVAAILPTLLGGLAAMLAGRAIGDGWSALTAERGLRR